MRLPAAAQIGWREPGRSRVIGVHLHRQVAGGVEELEEEREDGPRRMPTQQFGAPLPHQFAERRSGQRAGRHDALVGAAVNEFP
jgi:hypothetical protein